MKENLGKLEEAMALLVVEALGLSRLRFVKAGAEADSDKQHSIETKLCCSSSDYSIQQEISRTEKEAADVSCVTSDKSEGNRQRETMDEFVAIGEVVLQESVLSIALWDATNAIRQVYHRKGMIGVFGVLYCVFEDESDSLAVKLEFL
ncbi:uncharacterized protein MONOS_3536 [Monocercomonoides exilis]|uniref:uncharacterized protein n=1 Tax=Monocercomonoides exilis TaxID=2049356 RepID=UPI0035595432|nr:hypothetical protein MONOS_3536 [Monocercomonoides exilis]|eukprot:MONOS_3536.1-p1 / transcript=MONOS_3536.1 / gene=MONOS_3536 / organism=Monocercomonoides_exilis_PA203 / gene_product=unspecified product / transcript_product=unspecified product / location=Mono_scaffold00084:5140-5993(+) / protein_length=148 / sequence_SO=supercontig / SO=protein_coding / is_pseudo=false